MEWINDFNTILREIIFADDELKNLMLIPEGTKIIEFMDRYFIRAGYTNKILSDEDVRIVYGSTPAGQAGSNVTRNIMSFDIYVKTEHIHDVGKDRLVMRTQLIAYRLIRLLMKNRYIGVYRFFDPTDGDMGTSAIGYARYNVSFSYMKTY